MLELLSDPAVWVSFATLTVMEIVLGIDNVVFISVLVQRLPAEQAKRARQIGLALALIFRILLLLVLSWIIALREPVITIMGLGLSWRDLILLAGGLFLIYKATHEMHAAIEEPHEANLQSVARAGFTSIILQIIVIDMVFSVDSIITAIGMADHVEVMVAAVIIAVAFMYAASGTISDFIAKHPTTKMLALSFLLLIGFSLALEGIHVEIEKGYIYSAMAFSVLVEVFNILMKQRKIARGEMVPYAADIAVHTSTLPGTAAVAQPTGATSRPRISSTPVTRAQARPKSAPRKPR